MLDHIRNEVSVPINNLAAGDAAAVISTTLEEDFLLLKLNAHAMCHGVTTSTLLVLAVQDGGLSAQEGEEALEATPTDRNFSLVGEAVDRPIWVIGTCNPSQDLFFRNPQGGTVLQMPVQWTFSDAEGWEFVVYNTVNGTQISNVGGEQVIIYHDTFGRFLS